MSISLCLLRKCRHVFIGNNQCRHPCMTPKGLTLRNRLVDLGQKRMCTTAYNYLSSVMTRL